MQCECCRPHRPLQKTPQENHKRGNACNQLCPLMVASRAVTITNPQPLAAAMLGMGEAQPFVIGQIAPGTLPIPRSANVHSPTLLSLSCALTV
jgi:hypothetical protein